MIGQKMSFLLPLSPGEVRARLDLVVTTRRNWLFDFARYVSVRRDRKQFYGRVDDRKFCINFNEWTNEPWVPRIEGTIRAEPSGTRVDATVGVSTLALVSLLPLLVLFGAFASTSIQEWMPSDLLFALWALFVIGFFTVRLLHHIRVAKTLFVRALGDVNAAHGPFGT
jgi:hypothetical protein